MKFVVMTDDEKQEEAYCWAPEFAENLTAFLDKYSIKTVHILGAQAYIGKFVNDARKLVQPNVNVIEEAL